MNIQKILPACAVAMGVALVMATSAFKEAPKDKSGDPLYTFQYNPPGTDPYSVANVEDVGNWSYTANTDPCTSGTAKACKIYASHVDNSGPEPVLLTSENISATLNMGTGTARVVSTADGSGSSFISNKPN